MGLSWGEGKNHFHWPASHTFYEAQDTVGFLSWSTHCCLMPNFSFTSISKSFSSGLPLIYYSPSLYRYWGMLWCRCRPRPRTWPHQTSQDSYGPLLQPEGCLGDIHSLVEINCTCSVWRHPQTSWRHTQTHCMSLVILNPIDHIMDSWGTAHISDLHLDIKQLTANLWMQLSGQFLIYLTVYSSIPCLSNLVTNDVVGDTIKGPTERKPL